MQFGAEAGQQGWQGHEAPAKVKPDEFDEALKGQGKPADPPKAHAAPDAGFESDDIICRNRDLIAQPVSDRE